MISKREYDLLCKFRDGFAPLSGLTPEENELSDQYFIKEGNMILHDEGVYLTEWVLTGKGKDAFNQIAVVLSRASQQSFLCYASNRLDFQVFRDNLNEKTGSFAALMMEGNFCGLHGQVNSVNLECCPTSSSRGPIHTDVNVVFVFHSLFLIGHLSCHPPSSLIHSAPIE